VEITAGSLHRVVGGYPGTNHRMPICCQVMYDTMGPDDEVVTSPPSGKGASLRIRYQLPRDT
jgi:5-methylcytosine-specific restriction protein A